MKDGKGQFYRQLKLDKESKKVIQLYRRFKYQLLRGLNYFPIENKDEGSDVR